MPMTFSERQRFIQTLAQARNPSIAFERSKPPSSSLQRRCEDIIRCIDDVAQELVGDAGLFKVIEASGVTLLLDPKRLETPDNLEYRQQFKHDLP